MISEQLIVAVMVMLPALIVPTVIVVINNNNARKLRTLETEARKQEKLDDYARVDALEERRKKDADEVARLLKANTAAQVESFGELKGLGEQTHTLVNSNLTKEMKARLLVMQAGLATLIELADLRKSMGHPESASASQQISAMSKAIDELEADLATRREVTGAAAVERKATEVATKAAVAAVTAAGPLPVTILQDEHNPVPVKPIVQPKNG